MYYKNDPYWTTARFVSVCPKCGRQIRKGSDIFYYPKGKQAYCRECGKAESASFEAAAFDEYVYSQGRG